MAAGLSRWIGPLSISARVALALAALFATLAALVALGSLVAGWRIAVPVAVALAGVGALAMLFVPVAARDPAVAAAPAQGYAAALARFRAELLPAPAPLNPLCASCLLTHGTRTGTVVVLLHGVSSCPHAFVDFAPLLHRRGHTVMVVRMPRNGYADRATDALRHLTADELVTFANTVVDVAAGLGERVVFLGISAGGTVAGWAVQNRAEVDRAVLVAPFYGLGRTGARLNVGLMRAMLALPDVSIWKDPVLRARYEGGRAHAYKRQSTRATAEILRLGFRTRRQARTRAPAGGAIAVITNDADAAVSNAATAAMVRAWRARGVEVATHAFAAHHGLGHELIDPQEPGADTALTYPVVLRLVEGGDAGASACARVSARSGA